MDEIDLSSSTLASFKSVIFNNYKSALAVSYGCEDPRSFKSICLKCNSALPFSRPITCCMYVVVVFLVPLCFLIFLALIFLLVSRPNVIGHSCCGVPANVLSVCLLVCLFFFGEANNEKIIKYQKYLNF